MLNKNKYIKQKFQSANLLKESLEDKKVIETESGSENMENKLNSSFSSIYQDDSIESDHI